jgi:hypothetical protein
MKFLVVFLIVSLFIPSGQVWSDDTTISDLQDQLETKIVQEGAGNGSEEIEIVKKNLTQEEMKAEYDRRLKKYASYGDKPWMNQVGPMTVYMNKDWNGDCPRLVIPAGEAFRIIERNGIQAKVYVPYYDVIGYMCTIESCQYRAYSWDGFDWSKVNFKPNAHQGRWSARGPNSNFTFPPEAGWEEHIAAGNVNGSYSIRDFKLRDKDGNPVDHGPEEPNAPVHGNNAESCTRANGPGGSGTSGSSSNTTNTTTSTYNGPPAPGTVSTAGNDNFNASPPSSGQITYHSEVHIRGAESLESDVVTVLKPGSTFEIIDQNSEWTKIKVDGKTGYLRTQYLK